MSDQGTKKELTEEELWAEFAAQEEGVKEPKTASQNDEFTEIPEGAKTPPADGAAPDGAAAPPADQEADIWQNAPPDLKAAHDAQVRALQAATTEHARRSIEGRIASYTRRLQERNEAAAQPPAKAPTEEEAADPFAELAAEYPEIATPLQKKLAPITEKISQFEATEKSRQQAADAQMDADLQANEQLLETYHPGWDDFLHEYGAAFVAWIDDQPLAIRQGFAVNQNAIIDPASAIETLDAFKQFVADNQSPAGGAAAQPPPAQQQRLNPRRAAQLAGSASPQAARTRPTPSGIPEDGDPEAIWKAFAAIDPDEKKYRNA